MLWPKSHVLLNGGWGQLKGWLCRADNNSVTNTPIIYAPSHALAHFASEFAAENEKSSLLLLSPVRHAWRCRLSS